MLYRRFNIWLSSFDGPLRNLLAALAIIAALVTVSAPIMALWDPAVQSSSASILLVCGFFGVLVIVQLISGAASEVRATLARSMEYVHDVTHAVRDFYAQLYESSGVITISDRHTIEKLHLALEQIENLQMLHEQVLKKSVRSIKSCYSVLSDSDAHVVIYKLENGQTLEPLVQDGNSIHRGQFDRAIAELNESGGNDVQANEIVSDCLSEANGEWFSSVANINKHPDVFKKNALINAYKAANNVEELPFSSFLVSAISADVEIAEGHKSMLRTKFSRDAISEVGIDLEEVASPTKIANIGVLTIDSEVTGGLDVSKSKQSNPPREMIYAFSDALYGLIIAGMWLDLQGDKIKKRIDRGGTSERKLVSV